MSDADLCASLGLTGINLALCQTLENQPLTADLLYKIFSTLEPKLPILTNGLENIVKENSTRLLIQNVIIQQLPCLVSAVLILLALLTTKTISFLVFFVLLVAILVITAIVIIANLYLNKYTIEGTLNEFKTQLNSNIKDFKKKAL